MSFRFQRKYLSIPYIVFFLLFIIVPIFLIIYYAFTDKATGNFSFINLVHFFSDMTNINVLIISLVFALATTVICLIIGYPVAYILANKKFNKNKVIVMLFVMPMWINFIIRTGATRDLLTWIGLGGGTHPTFATLVGLVYNYLPFTVLPLYSTMLKMDRSLIEASADLGANPVQTFIKVIIPMTMPGIVSACTMVFMPTISSYVISDLLSEYNIVLFGSYIDLYFNQANWNFGAFMALIMLILVGISVVVTRKFSKEENILDVSSNLFINRLLFYRFRFGRRLEWIHLQTIRRPFQKQRVDDRGWKYHSYRFCLSNCFHDYWHLRRNWFLLFKKENEKSYRGYNSITSR